MSRLQEARDTFSRLCVSSRNESIGVHTVTFQPLATCGNDDRLTAESWTIHGDRWIFLVVCDGHCGSHVTAEHTVNVLPDRLRAALDNFIEVQMHGATDREIMLSNAATISSLLEREVEEFDEDLGMTIKRICPDPNKLTEEESKALVQDHLDVIERAYCGCTLAAALVHVASQCLWTLNVGDSTVGLSYETASGEEDWIRLCENHKLTNPREYFRVVMEHPLEERRQLTDDDRILGWLDMTRSIGDYAMKLDSSYITHLFDYNPDPRPRNPKPEIIKTPPYLSAKPSVRFLDLAPLWDAKPRIFLFSDGVDAIIYRYASYIPNIDIGIDIGTVVAKLLGNQQDRKEAGKLLGHHVEPDWSKDGNKAVEVLGNLFGGTNAERLEEANQQAAWTDHINHPSFYIDDTTLIICTLSE
ncbi:protein serine/threonine phosphatase 2C [Pilatotrama ljubarskyi]|nr:protein serine/threonine phosphatase 2C [Pilatotrama ljubarskyi]